MGLNVDNGQCSTRFECIFYSKLFPADYGKSEEKHFENAALQRISIAIGGKNGFAI